MASARKNTSIVVAEDSHEMNAMPSTVPKNYMGTEDDRKQMKALGRKQEMRVRE